MTVSILHRVLNLIERLSSKGLGKGFGAVSVKHEANMLKKLLNKPRLGIDIGGNIGEYSAQLRENFREMEIHIFEPSITNLEKLILRFALDPGIIINNKALSDSSGTAALFSNISGSGLGSLTKRNLEHFDINFDVKEAVEMIRFEDYWEHTLLKRDIDLAKIDVEGHELNVLKGFGKAIYKTKIIQFEFGGCNIDTRTYFQDFWYFFKENSFKIYRITPFGCEHIQFYKESHETFLTTNYLCVNESMK